MSNVILSKMPLLLENKSKLDMDNTDMITFVGDEPVAKRVQEALIPRLEDLSVFIESDIVFVTCHSNRSVVPRKVDDRVHIFSMMTPAWVDFERKKIDTYTINEDVIVLPPGLRDYVDPRLEEIPNCDGIYDDDGRLMALIVGYNIYLLNDAMHCKSPTDLECAMHIFEYIINEAVKLWIECEFITE